VEQLKKEWPNKVYLATDPDRKGVYIPLAKQPLGEMELVGCVAGVLQEKVRLFLYSLLSTVPDNPHIMPW
jgi:hypothetical protein